MLFTRIDNEARYDILHRNTECLLAGEVIKVMAVTFFHELERMGILRRFQADLYLLTGLTFDFVDVEARSSLCLRAVEKFIPFCRRVNSVPLGRRACENCTRNAVRRCLEGRRDLITTCHLGLIDIFVPLVVGSGTIGALSTGQFLLRAPMEKGFLKIRPRLEEMGVNIKKARSDYLHIPVIEKVRLLAIIDIIHMVVDSMVTAARSMPLLRSASREDKVARAREYIESKYAENISARDIAATVHLSPSRLRHLFKDSVNTTLTDYVNNVRLHWAKYYLENSALRVGEIAFRVGFENMSHFNHQFHAKTGLSPLQFRRQSGTKK